MIRELEWPKGMEPPIQAPGEKKPVLISLADGNYVGAIHHALSVLPVKIQVNKCLVLEQVGRTPEVRLSLTILGKKEGDNVERKHPEL